MSEAADAIDWEAVEAALTAHATTGIRSPLMAAARRADPAGYAKANARAMAPIREAEDRRRLEQARKEVARGHEAKAAQAKAAAKRDAMLADAIDARLRALGVAP